MVSNFSEHFFLKILPQSSFLTGVFYGSFISLPFSLTGLLSLQRLFIQGRIAGFISFLGIIYSDCFFLSLILFGQVKLINFWVSIFPLIFLMGIYFYVTFFFQTILNPFSFKSIDLNTNELIKIFLISFFLNFSNISLINGTEFFLDLNFISYQSNFSFIFGILISQLFISITFCLFSENIFIFFNKIFSRIFFKEFSNTEFSKLFSYLSLFCLLQASIEFPWIGCMSYIYTYSGSFLNQYTKKIFNPKPSVIDFGIELDVESHELISNAPILGKLDNYTLPNTEFVSKNNKYITSKETEKTTFNKNRLSLPKFFKNKDQSLFILNRPFFHSIKEKSSIQLQRQNLYSTVNRVGRTSKPIWKNGDVCNLYLYKHFYFEDFLVLNFKPSSINQSTRLTGISLDKLNKSVFLNEYFSKNFVNLLTYSEKLK